MIGQGQGQGPGCSQLGPDRDNVEEFDSNGRDDVSVLESIDNRDGFAVEEGGFQLPIAGFDL
eukprot:gene10999-14722_t